MAVKDEKILGFLGLGAMGTAMCYGLVKCGFQVVLPAYRREIDTAAGFSPVAPDAEAKAARYDEMLAGTGIAAASQRELIEKADVLLISMPTSRQVEGLMYGEDGIMECIRLGSAVIDLTSADPNSTKKLAAELEKKGEKYDVVILDPPAFTKSRNSIKNAVRGYREINLRAMKLVKDRGFLATCSCSHFMDYELFTQTIGQAARNAHKRLRQVEFRTQAPDHPILWGAGDSYYLKFYIFQVCEE